MGFQLYQKKPVRASSSEPQASFGKQRIRFNQKAFINCELAEKPRVLFHIDEERRRVGFEFTDNLDDDYVYTVTPSKKGHTATVKIQGLLDDYRWIKAVSLLKNTKDRQFTMREDRGSGIWIIQLIPAFEFTTTDISSVPTSSKGIYRYLDNRGEVLYIGEGNIKERYQEPERRTWHISEIGYSIVNDQAERKRYESFWLDHHKKHHQHLPTYNKVSGMRIAEG